jgi:PPOX class probable F420-dependent enzyme
VLELSEAVRAFLEEVRFAVAATINSDGTPQQTVVWYELRGHEIIMNTAKGRLKDRNLRRDPRMSLCIEDGYRYLTIKGRAVLDETNAQKDIEALLIRYYGPERTREMMRTQFSKEHRVTVRLRIEKISGIGL